jgi:putative membrane protein
VAGVITLDSGTRLAVERTRLAHERTLMSWIRTATSLISFGFTIYKFFDLEGKGPPSGSQVVGPRAFALLMIVIGLATLLLAAVGHRQTLQSMRVEFGPMPVSTAAMVAALISLLGILALITVLLRG